MCPLFRGYQCVCYSTYSVIETFRFGDRIIKFGSQDFRNITRKEAAEMIRSCDLTSITVEIGRAHANIKPAPQVGTFDFRCILNIPTFSSFDLKMSDVTGSNN